MNKQYKVGITKNKKSNSLFWRKCVLHDIFFIFFGYLSGSILYAQIFVKWFCSKNLMEISFDGNPGTANAFQHGGFVCGILTLIFDVLKGFIPVYLSTKCVNHQSYFNALVIAAPVIGHIFPIFNHFHGGKGIAVTFGCLLGLLPMWKPLTILAIYFILFSVAIRITPDYYRTLAAYICSLATLSFFSDKTEICIGFAFICMSVVLKLLTSKEKKAPLEVNILWIH